jgi:hypothetical protein
VAVRHARRDPSTFAAKGARTAATRTARGSREGFVHHTVDRPATVSTRPASVTTPPGRAVPGGCNEMGDCNAMRPTAITRRDRAERAAPLCSGHFGFRPSVATSDAIREDPLNGHRHFTLRWCALDRHELHRRFTFRATGRGSVARGQSAGSGMAVIGLLVNSLALAAGNLLVPDAGDVSTLAVVYCANGVVGLVNFLIFRRVLDGRARQRTANSQLPSPIGELARLAAPRLAAA